MAVAVAGQETGSANANVSGRGWSEVCGKMRSRAWRGRCGVGRICVWDARARCRGLGLGIAIGSGAEGYAMETHGATSFEKTYDSARVRGRARVKVTDWARVV